MRQSIIAQNMPASGIRKMFSLASKYNNVINLCIGEPDFNTPRHIIDAGCYALNNGYTKYVDNSGLLVLRQEIAKKAFNANKITCDENNVIVTNGAGQALMSAIQCALNPGESVIIADPYYPNYLGYLKLAGAEAIAVETNEKDNFHISASIIEKNLKSNTKAILINSPSNPTGAVLSFTELKEIAELAKCKDLIVISDEPYESIVFDHRKNYSIASIEGMFDRTITINSFSKTYAMTGWRIGYAIADESFIKSMTIMQESLSSSVNAASQYAAFVALTRDNEETKNMCCEYEHRAEFLEKEINKIKGFYLKKPEGAFYAFVNIKETGLSSLEVAQKLIDKCQVIVTPGSAFGVAGEGYIRISFASKEDSLNEAIERIKAEFGEK